MSNEQEDGRPTQVELKNGKLVTKFAAGGIVGLIVLFASLLAARPIIVAALSIPEQVNELREANNVRHKDLTESIMTIKVEVRNLQDRRENERLILQRLDTQMTYVLKMVEDIQRQQRRNQPQ